MKKRNPDVGNCTNNAHIIHRFAYYFLESRYKFTYLQSLVQAHFLVSRFKSWFEYYNKNIQIKTEVYFLVN